MPVTKKYDWSQFRLKIYINKPVSRVFRAWTDQREVSRWFTVETIIEPKRKGRIYFKWLAGDELETKVISITKNKSFSFPFGENGEKVKVSFKKDGNGCICTLHQFDMKTDPKSKWTMHRGCIQGWVFFLANLKSYLENRIDLRSHEDKKSYKYDYINS